MPVHIELKRAYDPRSRDDGVRVLVDRLWPRGLSKAKVHIDAWPKELAPSNELRRWYGHDPKKWLEFKHRYFTELKSHEDELSQLVDQARKQKLTLVYAAKEPRFHNAAALKEYIEAKL